MIDNDPEKKLFIINWLSSIGFTDIIDTDTISIYCHHDIEAKKDGKEYRFELKSKPCPITKWKDMEIEEFKFNYLRRLCNSGYKVFLIVVYTDCVGIIDISKDNFTRYKKKCQWTNNWDRRKVDKVMINWKAENFYKINIKKLEKFMVN